MTQAERLQAGRRAARACPTSAAIEKAVATIDAEALRANGAEHTAGAAGGVREVAAQMKATRACADDPTDPRRAMAAGDLGAAMARQICAFI